jgi:hypothetical protein
MTELALLDHVKSDILYVIRWFQYRFPKKKSKNWLARSCLENLIRKKFSIFKTICLFGIFTSITKSFVGGGYAKHLYETTTRNLNEEL